MSCSAVGKQSWSEVFPTMNWWRLIDIAHDFLKLLRLFPDPGIASPASSCQITCATLRCFKALIVIMENFILQPESIRRWRSFHARKWVQVNIQRYQSEARACVFWKSYPTKPTWRVFKQHSGNHTMHEIRPALLAYGGNFLRETNATTQRTEQRGVSKPNKNTFLSFLRRRHMLMAQNKLTATQAML